MEAMIRRLVLRMFPEMSGGLHLPQWGRIEAVYSIEAAGKSDRKEPLYCADIQLLNSNGAPDLAVPVFKKVPLFADGAGDSRGVFLYPKVGALAELGFILGHPDKPFIRTILTQGLTVRAIGKDDALFSKDANNYYHIDTDNNLNEKCQAIAERIATTKQRLVVEDGGKVWVGNETENALRLLSDLANIVKEFAAAVATHTHPSVAASQQAGTFTTQSTSADTVKTKVDSFKE